MTPKARWPTHKPYSKLNRQLKQCYTKPFFLLHHDVNLWGHVLRLGQHMRSWVWEQPLPCTSLTLCCPQVEGHMTLQMNLHSKILYQGCKSTFGFPSFPEASYLGGESNKLSQLSTDIELRGLSPNQHTNFKWRDDLWPMCLQDIEESWLTDDLEPRVTRLEATGKHGRTKTDSYLKWVCSVQ